MKNRIKDIACIFLFLFSLITLTGCNEELTINTVAQGAPEITDFEPKTGRVGSEVTITGSQFRDVLSVNIGSVKAEIKYKISQTRMVVVVPGGTTGGKISVNSKNEESVSKDEFNVLFPAPSLTKVPESGKVEEEIEILGTNLDVITKVFFKDIEAAISYQNEKELVVKVPFVLAERVDILFKYYNEAGEQTIQTSGDAFRIVKPSPVLSNSMPANVNEGQEISLTGENLNLIEKVLFGNTPATISKKEAGLLVFRVPTLENTATVRVVAPYYEGTSELVLSEACEVFIPKVLFYPNLMIGAHRVADIGNLFNATTGDVLSACALKEPVYHKVIDFATVINSGYDLTINGPQKTINGIRNYWCDGKTFIKGNTVETLTAEGYGDFISTVTRFLVLSPDNATQADIINKVKSGAITDISPDATPALFNGAIELTQESARSRKNTEDPELTTAGIFKEGSVLVFRNERKNKVGILLIKKITVDYTAAKTYIDSNSSVEFDAYYER